MGSVGWEPCRDGSGVDSAAVIRLGRLAAAVAIAGPPDSDESVRRDACDDEPAAFDAVRSHGGIDSRDSKDAGVMPVGTAASAAPWP